VERRKIIGKYELKNILALIDSSNHLSVITGIPLLTLDKNLHDLIILLAIK
jgi:hypothetical protein